MLMDFAAEGGAPGDEGDEWVATHTNAQGASPPFSLSCFMDQTDERARPADPNSTTDIPSMGDIPDADDPSSSSSGGGGGVDGVTSSLADTSLGGGAAAARDEVPDFDDIPDMDDDDAGGAGLVEEDDDAAVQVEPLSSGTRCVVRSAASPPLDTHASSARR